MNDELEKINALPPEQRVPYALRRHNELKLELEEITDRRDEAAVKLEAVTDLLHWWESEPTLVLEKNEHSRLHKLRESIHAQHLISKTRVEASVEAIDQVQQTFVVKHDWARAFEGATLEGKGENAKLPYDICSFEFRVNGRAVIAIVRNSPEEEKQVQALLFFEGPHDYWAVVGPHNEEDPEENQYRTYFANFFAEEIWAICIALDAEVATHSVIRAPAKLNAKRAQKGRVPLYDYHVVDLARRHRISNPRPGTGEGSKKRLHFRRGHWRHYETHTTWVRWCLVGDPDLGFIDKHYSL